MAPTEAPAGEGPPRHVPRTDGERPPATLPSTRASTGASSSCEGESANAAAPAKGASTWKEAEVLAFFEKIGLTHVQKKLERSAVDGRVLCSLTEAEMVSELGLTKLQARKVMLYLR